MKPRLLDDRDLTPSENAELVIELEERARGAERERKRSAGYEQSLLVLKAVRLCPTVALCERYLRGERIPVSMIDQDWARAYELI